MGIVLGLLSDCACLSGTQDQKDLPPSLANHTCPMEDAFSGKAQKERVWAVPSEVWKFGHQVVGGDSSRRVNCPQIFARLLLVVWGRDTENSS